MGSGVKFTVQNLTIANGNAQTGGGGIASWGSLTVTNSTFSGNSAGDGGGGGISNVGATVTVTNTILANSTSGRNCSGTITDGGHNIDDGTTCGFSAANGSLNDTTPKLAAGLAKNGGPIQTIALLAGSPAINAGDESVCSAAPVNNLDQRGYVRPGTGYTNCFIGAYEADATAGKTCVGDCNSDGQVTIDELITLVNTRKRQEDRRGSIRRGAGHQSPSRARLN